MSDPSKPSVPLSGGFYQERANAVEQARIDDQRARMGRSDPAGHAANPRRTVLGDSGHAVPAQLAVRLPESLVLHVGNIVRREFEAGYDETDAGREQFANAVMASLREVDVAQLKA